jgi:hypothetical protein
LPSSRYLPRCLAGLCRLVGLDGSKLTVYRIELALQLFLLIENLLALGAEPIPLSGNILGKVAVAEIAMVINVGHSCSPDYQYEQSM